MDQGLLTFTCYVCKNDFFKLLHKVWLGNIFGVYEFMVELWLSLFNHLQQTAIFKTSTLQILDSLQEESFIQVFQFFINVVQKQHL